MKKYLTALTILITIGSDGDFWLWEKECCHPIRNRVGSSIEKLRGI